MVRIYIQSKNMRKSYLVWLLEGPKCSPAQNLPVLTSIVGQPLVTCLAENSVPDGYMMMEVQGTPQASRHLAMKQPWLTTLLGQRMARQWK